MTLEEAAAKINAQADAMDIGAAVRGRKLMLTRYGKPAGYITAAEIADLRHTPTGWGGAGLTSPRERSTSGGR